MKFNTTLLLAVLMIVTAVGCQSMPWRKAPPAEPPEMAAMRNQIQQYQARTNALEASNSQINIQLAQTKQELLSQQEANKRGNESYKALAQENIQLKRERGELIAKNSEQAQKLNIVAGALKVNGTTAIVPNNTVIPIVDFNDVQGAYARRDGQFYRVTITDSARRAAQDALNGWDPTGGAIYFYNPAKSTSKWIFSRPVVLTIGEHVFAK